jgi:CRP/FNR family transcriptional regulator, cyclic AMP receptor protein
MAGRIAMARDGVKTYGKATCGSQVFFELAGIARNVAEFRIKATIFTQGDCANSIMYIQKGRVKLSIVNEAGKEAVLAVLEPGDFLGEGCLTDQPNRIGTATTIAPTTLLMINKKEMIRSLHEESEFSDRFIAYMLSRNIRVEADLVDQLFNLTEKRLARTLLLLARHGKVDQPGKIVPKVSQEVLGEMIGATRSHVNLFMNKFKKLGFISYGDGLHVNGSLLSVVLND